MIDTIEEGMWKARVEEVAAERDEAITLLVRLHKLIDFEEPEKPSAERYGDPISINKVYADAYAFIKDYEPGDGS